MPLPDYLYWEDNLLVRKETLEVLGRIWASSRNAWSYSESSGAVMANMYNQYTRPALSGREFLTSEAAKAAVERQVELEEERKKAYREYVDIAAEWPHNKSTSEPTIETKTEKKGFIAWLLTLLNLN